VATFLTERFLRSGMTPEEVERLIEEHLDGAEATVTRARGSHDDDHLAATVVSDTFEGLSLVQQHQTVYDALGEHMTTDVHALELKTYTPAEYEEHADGE
jgi:acid stress-induced BolA-like protein IbaG/YrbA